MAWDLSSGAWDAINNLIGAASGAYDSHIDGETAKYELQQAQLQASWLAGQQQQNAATAGGSGGSSLLLIGGAGLLVILLVLMLRR